MLRLKKEQESQPVKAGPCSNNISRSNQDIQVKSSTRRLSDQDFRATSDPNEQDNFVSLLETFLNQSDNYL